MRTQVVPAHYILSRNDGLLAPGSEMRYLITFACYGARLHGDEAGSVDRDHNLFGGRLLRADPKRTLVERTAMRQSAYVLDEHRRTVVLTGLRKACSQRDWLLFAAHLRRTHVHVVLEAPLRPEQVLNALECYATRALNSSGCDRPDRKRWSRHGSTRWLWSALSVREAVRYVADMQGRPMAVFAADDL